jgi:DNA-binding beta-propeller fold protein YncE
MFGLPGREVLLEVVLNGCARPHASWIVGNRGYVTCEDEQVVLEVDLANGHPLRRFDTRQAGSHVLAFDPGSRTLSVSNTESGSITLINIDSGDARVISLGGGSEGTVALDGRIWVGNAWQGTVSVVNVRSGEVVHHSEKLCGFPISLSPDAHGRVWVACFGSAELIALDRETFELQRRIKLEAQPLNLLLHPRGDIAYVSLPRENAVAEISLHAGEISRRIQVGVEPDGLRWGD